MPMHRAPEDDRPRDAMLTAVRLPRGEWVGYAMNLGGWFFIDYDAGWNSRGVALRGPYAGPGSRPLGPPLNP